MRNDYDHNIRHETGYGSNEQVINTLLAALRLYQETGQDEPSNRTDSIDEIATNGGQEISLDGYAIDNLCRAINTGEIEIVQKNDLHKLAHLTNDAHCMVQNIETLLASNEPDRKGYSIIDKDEFVEIYELLEWAREIAYKYGGSDETSTHDTAFNQD